MVKLVRREKNRLFVIGLDAIDGSGLIDIKPYVRELDEAEA
ncbi:TrmO family methyltransferase [Dialister invisus]|nr:TrmO family methyltransferase [Dialister invisus]